MAEGALTPPSRFASAARAAQRPVERLEALIGAEDAPARVAALPVPDLFHLVQEVGLDDAHGLVALASPEQVQGLIDLDAWRGDALDDVAVVPWLEAVLEAGPDKLASVWRGLDQELAALLLARWVRVYNLAEEEVPDWEEPPFVPTPDRFFMLKVTAERAEIVRLVGQIVDGLYRADPELGRHTIRAAASEPTVELEEMAQRWRRGRMADLGFADPLEALALYQPIDLASIKIGERSADAPADALTLPAVLEGPTLRQPFLARVLARVTDAAEAQRLEAALVTLLNRVLAAGHVRPSDTVAAAAAAAAGAATLSLGLETVARGDEAQGAEALATIALARLFRAGVTVVRKLADAARVLAPRAARSEEPYLSLLAALARPRPEYPRALDDPPDLGTRPFAQAADVRRAAHALAVLAAQVTIVRDGLGADPGALGAAVTLGDVGRTALVQVLLGGGAEARRLAPDDVRRFAATLVAGRVPEVARAEALARMRERLEVRKIAPPQEFAAAIAGWIGDLERELGRLDTYARPDPRFIGGLFIE
jgi:hypothetical protein